MAEPTTEELDRRGTALVVTVHDLHNPHLEDNAAHLARTAHLVTAADAVITLTEAAARQVRARWGRVATVLPHPHVAPLERIDDEPDTGLRRGPGSCPLVGVDLKGLRTNTLHAPQLAALCHAVTAAGCELVVGIHREALDGLDSRDPELARVLRTCPGDRVSVVAHERYTDEGLLDHLARLDALVLPYRFGTHSGYLEACRDVGTAVVAPDVGCYHDQHSCPTYAPDHIASTLPSALGAALASRREWVATRPERLAERQHVREAHRRIYREVITQRSHPREARGSGTTSTTTAPDTWPVPGPSRRR